jgi:cyclitol reductase
VIPVGRPYRRIEITPKGLKVATAKVTEGTQEAKILVRVRLAGICRSDLKEISGERSVRRDFGHEIVGEIVAAEPPVLAIDSQVVYDPHLPVRRTTGFAELMEIEGTCDNLASALVRIPHDLPDEASILIEPLSCAVHCVRRMEEAGRAIGTDAGPVAVIGAGMAGVLITAVLKGEGVAVRLFNRSPDRLNDLRRRAVLSDCLATGPPGVHAYPRVVLATALATAPAMDTALSALADCGLLVLFAGTHQGFHHSGLDLDALRRAEHIASAPWGCLAGTYGALRTDFEQATSLLRDTLYDDAVQLINGRISLHEAAKLMQAQAGIGLLGKTAIDPYLSR